MLGGHCGRGPFKRRRRYHSHSACRPGGRSPIGPLLSLGTHHRPPSAGCDCAGERNPEGPASPACRRAAGRGRSERVSDRRRDPAGQALRRVRNHLDARAGLRSAQRGRDSPRGLTSVAGPVSVWGRTRSGGRLVGRPFAASVKGEVKLRKIFPSPQSFPQFCCHPLKKKFFALPCQTMRKGRGEFGKSEPFNSQLISLFLPPPPILSEAPARQHPERRRPCWGMKETV